MDVTIEDLNNAVRNGRVRITTRTKRPEPTG